MKNKIKMSEGLLDLIIMVQDYRKLLISEMMFKVAHDLPHEKDWYTQTQKYFNSIDDSILNKYGLCKNNISFEVVTRFKVTQEILSTDRKYLSKYECWTSCIPE